MSRQLMLTGPSILLLVLGAGCAQAGRHYAMAADLTPPPAAAMRAEAPAAGAPATVAESGAPAAAAVPVPSPALSRQIVYIANLQMVVPDTAAALKAVERSAVSLGGYLQQVDADSIIVRVPAGKLEQVMAAAEGLGQVTQRSLKGQDITEEMHDLQTRLETSMQVRQQLLLLLNKADKTADAIKVEQELERVIHAIEQIKGKMRFYESQVAFSTLTVKFNAPAPQPTLQHRIPFPWVRQLGDGLVGERPPCDPQENPSHGIRFDLPKSYMRFYGSDELAEAMSGDEVYVRVQRHDNHKGGDVDFWSTLARRTLLESRCVTIEKESLLTLQRKTTGRAFLGTRQVAGRACGYLLVVAPAEKSVYTFEAWGPAAALKRDAAALQTAAESLRLK